MKDRSYSSPVPDYHLLIQLIEALFCARHTVCWDMRMSQSVQAIETELHIDYNVIKASNPK